MVFFSNESMKIHIKSFVFGAASVIAIYYALKFLKVQRKKLWNDLEKSTANCLLFSPNQSTWGICSTRTGGFCRFPSCPLCSYRKFFALLKNTVSRIDICVYLITSDEITSLLIKLFNKGVLIRIITDKQMSLQGKHVRVRTFFQKKIPVKVIDTEDIMHNKFVIIDKKTLITGSFNWTHQGFTRNFENAVILHDKEVIRKYTDYFDQLWMSNM